jgi:hypothetical protein
MKIFYVLFAVLASVMLFASVEATLACPGWRQRCPVKCALSAKIVDKSAVEYCHCGPYSLKYRVCKPRPSCPVSRQSCPGKCALSVNLKNVQTCACSGYSFTVCKL